MKTKNEITINFSLQVVTVNYTDEQGNNVKKQYQFNELENLASFVSNVDSKLDELPIVLADVVYVTYEEDIFSITGEKYPPVIKKYADLSADRKLIIDNLRAKILEVKGVTMTSLSTKFGSNKVTINNVEYPYSDFISTEFSNAITLAIAIYNENQN
jgi:hypothetical protein